LDAPIKRRSAKVARIWREIENVGAEKAARPLKATTRNAAVELVTIELA
jgi:hypothetical protein